MKVSPPLVVGYPRTGFTLLISVIAEIGKYGPPVGPRREVLRTFCETAGMRISARIEDVFRSRSLTADLLYNGNFREMAGGPKWLKEEEDGIACFRKYIGVRGKGDFTLITSHPRETLDYYDIVHSHVGPQHWSMHPAYADHRRFASIRNPAGALASACFSINALASEYIQRFVPAEADDDRLRQQLALYKLSDLNFFEALLGPFKAYLEAFSACAERYHVMRWEDLIEQPGATIRDIASAMGVTLQDAEVADIWRRLDHVNLTGAHRHNYRSGHGVVGGWRRWLTNTHLDMIRDYGLDGLARRYGYGPVERFDEAAYTPFQRKLADAIACGEVLREYEDDDLFGYAFNKSNLDWARFGFKHYDWRRHTRIERSSCTDDSLVMAVWDAAEQACATVNEALACWLAVCREGTRADRWAAVETMAAIVAPLFDGGEALDEWRRAMSAALEQEGTRDSPMQRPPCAPARVRPSEPVLLQSVGSTNIVEFDSRYYALPQSLGPVDFHVQDATALPGVLVASSLSDVLTKLAAG
ncbi:hypothetical protein WKR88_22260 [Trinickia caryophylli]|uniref:Sulfotransferase family protein n=1 Tax=Trinickia caryophylli TaxID=28094 RepID=A0A1X7CNK2_TRICW|nr:hypothetical protein [Trinickia caryophylli]PMS11269.1 hypothetical protein C0Z17_15750 [Trinickia caryophylli]TRX20122.1 sulfotransferase domain-containing protein [Trinickia caryophylli]WQE12527.1 hypothetical protein U0034_03635 [Trinickia caryophylli]SME99972.1 hypothetical protein SAMN06295900_101682 [Trinickia caryophylli]GLU30212.1 hypothetical protein Busp01_00540 [Trinickia caryophylli]